MLMLRYPETRYHFEKFGLKKYYQYDQFINLSTQVEGIFDILYTTADFAHQYTVQILMVKLSIFHYIYMTKYTTLHKQFDHFKIHYMETALHSKNARTNKLTW